MKNILLLVHDDAGQEARLQAALDLTRAFGGHLICLDVVQLPVAAAAAFDDPTPFILAAERAIEGDNMARLECRLTREDVLWEMRQVVGDFADSLADNAGLADLIVVSRKLDDLFSPDMRSVASSTVLKSGKPIVAVAEASRGFDVNGRALVAWDGSLPAMAALSAAVPLLRHASSVLLLEVEGLCPSSVEEGASYLSHYGIHPTVRQSPKGDGAAAQIEKTIQSDGAAYCVMGAYGHRRIREALFGGVTTHMLAHSTVPLFLAH